MENKKRKGKDKEEKDHSDEVEEEEDEEMKMDKFYALLRRFRDARDRRRKELEELEKKKRKLETEQHSSVWVPSFESEDFTNDFEFRGRHLRFTTTPSTSSSPRVTDKRKNEQHLDLNLAL